MYNNYVAYIVTLVFNNFYKEKREDLIVSYRKFVPLVDQSIKEEFLPLKRKEVTNRGRNILTYEIRYNDWILSHKALLFKEEERSLFEKEALQE